MSETSTGNGKVVVIALTHEFFRIHQENEPEGGSENSTFIAPADLSAEAREPIASGGITH
jgi:D-alanine--(R)-lactate ligase